MWPGFQPRDASEAAEWVVLYRGVSRDAAGVTKTAATGLSSIDPRLLWALGGGAAGGLGGLLLDRTKDEEERSPLSSMLTGALAGGATGAGLGLLRNPLDLNTIKSWFAKKHPGDLPQGDQPVGDQPLTVDQLQDVQNELKNRRLGKGPSASEKFQAGRAESHRQRARGEPQGLATNIADSLVSVPDAVSQIAKNPAGYAGAVSSDPKSTFSGTFGAGAGTLAGANIARKVIDPRQIAAGAAKIDAPIQPSGKDKPKAESPSLRALAQLINRGSHEGYAGKDVGINHPDVPSAAVPPSRLVRNVASHSTPLSRAKDLTRLAGRDNFGHGMKTPNVLPGATAVPLEDIAHNETTRAWLGGSSLQQPATPNMYGGTSTAPVKKLVALAGEAAGPSFGSTQTGLEALRQHGSNWKSQLQRGGLTIGGGLVGGALGLLPFASRNSRAAEHSMLRIQNDPANQPKVKLIGRQTP